MATPAGQPADMDPRVPDADPASIRSCLQPQMLSEFDREWESVLESAKVSKELGGIHRMLTTWRHLAYAEIREPGSNSALLAKAERIKRTGDNPDAVPTASMRELVDRRLGR